MAFVARAAFSISGLLFLDLLSPAAGKYAHVDPAKVTEILSKMTLREKLEETGIPAVAEPDLGNFRVNPLDIGNFIPIWVPEKWFDLKDNERLGLRGFRTRDGPRGITCLLGGSMNFGPPCPQDGSSPSFPHANLRATTWDTALEEEFGAATGEVAKALDIHAALLPCINILPWLNAGRGQESYGEDPFFNGKMGAATVRGVQSKGVMATPKHFLANNIENTRWMVSADMDDKTLHEVYLKQWAILIAESSPEFIMTSYNRVQGNWSNVDPKFIGLLREKLGFQGSIMTDWLALMKFSVASLTASPFAGRTDFFGEVQTALTAGVDMEMPFNSRHIQVVRKLAACEVSDADACHMANMLDRAVAHLLRSKIRYGLVGSGRPPKKTTVATYDNAKYAELALRIAQRGIVLLQNKESFLPKRPTDVSSVIVLGSADELELGDHGSSAQKPSGPMVTVLQGLQEKYGFNKVQFLGLDQARSEAVRLADMVVLDVGTNHTFEGEFIPPNTGGDRMYLTLHPHEARLVREVVSVTSKVVVAMSSGQNMIVEEFVHDVPAVLWLGYPGPLGGRAFADILAGDTNPSGRMTSATPKTPADWVPRETTLQPWIGAAVAYPYSHGFKHMWQAKIEPRFPMGWGLSYTTFSFGEPALRTTEGSLDLRVTVAVKNTGALAGIETVQVYATCPGCKQKRLPVLLVGFAKVHLAVGATEEASVSVSAKELAVYDASAEKWLLEKGTYKLLVGPCLAESSLQDLSYTVKKDFVFDYDGAKTRPHVEGAEMRQCTSFTCAPDQEFNAKERSDIQTARAVMAAMLLVTLLFLVGLCFCCCRCCKKIYQRWFKAKAKAKAKDS